MIFNNDNQYRPLNTFPAWKYVMVVVVLAFGFLYAMPNIFDEDNAVQISGSKGEPVTDGQLFVVERTWQENGDTPSTVELRDGKVIATFATEAERNKAQATAQAALGDNYVVAKNKEPRTPDWLRSFNAEPMKLGLDLRGGVHFLLEVDMDEALNKQTEQYIGSFRSAARDMEPRLRKVSYSVSDDHVMTARFASEADRDRAFDNWARTFPNLDFLQFEAGGRYQLRMTFQDTKISEIKDTAIKQNIATLRNRVNAIGVAEPLIQRQGADRISVDLPGVEDSVLAKRILGSTATLEFRLTDTQSDIRDALDGRVPGDATLMYTRDGQPVLVKKRVELTGEHIINALSERHPETQEAIVSVTLDGEGGSRMNDLTSKNIGSPMAMVMKEVQPIYEEVDGERVLSGRKKITYDLISAPRINGQFGSNFIITGQFTPKETGEMALILRSGSLIAPVYFVEERTIGPSLGKDNIEQGVKSVIIGFCLVLVFMIVYYRVFGIVANVALTLNLVLVVAAMSILGATLTMPGIAGIVLTVGMAVDANVLIFERIREELSDKVSPAQAIHNGYDRALSTIADANITTLIVAIILFAIGTGPIKGFAVTLMLGIVTSMFTAIVVTRAVVNQIYGGKTVKKLSI